MTNDSGELQQPESGTVSDIAVRPFSYRGQQQKTKVPTSIVSLEKLAQLHQKLSQKAGEALDKFLKSQQPMQGQSTAQFEEMVQQIRSVGGLTVAVKGKCGTQIVVTNVDDLQSISLPDQIASIDFDSAASLKAYNFVVWDWFRLHLDFTTPSLPVGYDPFDEPTPNASQLEVVGEDDTWVTATNTSTLEFFRGRSTQRNWLHSPLTFGLLSWLVGLPGSLWIASRFDTALMELAPTIHGGIRGAADIYIFLLGFLLFRVMLFSLRHLYPVIELKENTSKRPRKTINTVILALFAALLWDVIKFFVT